MLKNNANGEKKSKAINLDKFEQGAKWSSLSDAIDLEYYGVTFDTDNKYLYYSSTLIYPEYL